MQVLTRGPITIKYIRPPFVHTLVRSQQTLYIESFGDSGAEEVCFPGGCLCPIRSWYAQARKLPSTEGVLGLRVRHTRLRPQVPRRGTWKGGDTGHHHLTVNTRPRPES